MSVLLHSALKICTGLVLLCCCSAITLVFPLILMLYLVSAALFLNSVQKLSLTVRFKHPSSRQALKLCAQEYNKSSFLNTNNCHELQQSRLKFEHSTGNHAFPRSHVSNLSEHVSDDQLSAKQTDYFRCRTIRPL
jgi:hypothetical protein